MTDKILLNECRFFCRVGVDQLERATPQQIIIDLEIFFDIKKAALSDNIFDTVDYCNIQSAIKAHLDTHEYCLIETLAEKLTALLLEKFSIEKIFLRIKKPEAMKKYDVTWTGIEIIRP